MICFVLSGAYFTVRILILRDSYLVIREEALIKGRVGVIVDLIVLFGFDSVLFTVLSTDSVWFR